MAVMRLNSLQMERDNLLERWKEHTAADRAKILVKLIDLDEDIDRISKEDRERREQRAKFIG